MRHYQGFLKKETIDEQEISNWNRTFRDAYPPDRMRGEEACCLAGVAAYKVDHSHDLLSTQCERKRYVFEL